MDHNRFDTVVASLGTSRPRRALLAAAGAVALGLRATLTPAIAAASKPKRCPKKQTCGRDCCAKGERCLAGICGRPCTFTTENSTMTLDSDCVATEDITVPNGMTLDGANHRITLAGKRRKPPVILVSEGFGQVRRLTLDARRLTGNCSTHRDLIQFDDSSGAIEKVTIRGLSCGTGIIARADAADQNVTISQTLVEGAGTYGIYFVGNTLDPTARMYASVLDSEVRGIGKGSFPIGVYSLYNAEVQVKRSRIAASRMGIASYVQTVLIAEDNTITGAAIGISVVASTTTDVSLTATGNRINGPTRQTNAGIDIDGSVNAVITDNRVSNYRRGIDPCGIRIADGNQPVTLTGNTFPPPGNREDICNMRL